MSMIRTWRWDSSWHGSYAAVWWVIHSFQFCFILLNLVCSHQCSRPTVYVLGTKRDAKKCRAGTFPCWGQLPSRSALSFFPPCTVPWKPGLDGPQHRDPGPLALHCLAGEVWQEMGGQEGAVGVLTPHLPPELPAPVSGSFCSGTLLHTAFPLSRSWGPLLFPFMP